MGVVVADMVKRPNGFIHEVLKPFAENDDFIRRLLEVSAAFNDPNCKVPKQDIHMCILRTDFLVDTKT